MEGMNNEECRGGECWVDEVWEVIVEDLRYWMNNGDLGDKRVKEK